MVLGGGYAGAGVIAALRGRVKLTLVEPRDRLFHCIAAPRAVDADGVAETLFIPYDRLLRGDGRGTAATHVCGSATSIDPAARTVEVALAGGGTSTLEYDFLVIALGSSNAGVCKPSSPASATALAALVSVRDAVRDAKVVAVVGGGPSGVDVAGEIATEVPGVEVHLVQRGAALLTEPAGLPPAFRASVTAALAQLGVRVHCGVSAAAPPEPLPAGVVALDGGRVLLGAAPLTLSDGTTLQPQVVIYATGATPASAALRAGPLAAALDGEGRLRVDASFQVEGFEGIFALGDICNTAESKLAYNAGMHVPIVAKNIAALAAARAAGGPAPVLATYRAGGYSSAVLTVGRRHAFGTLNGMTLPGFVVKMVKGDLLVGKQTAAMGWTKAGDFPGAAAPAAE